MTVTELEVPEPEEIPEAQPDIPDGVQLLKSGRARFTLGGRTFTLRSATLGDIKDYRKRVDAEMEKRSEDQNDWIEGNYRVIAWVFERMGDKRLPRAGSKESADMPAWLVSGTLATQLLTHWQNVPLASGDQ